MTITKEQFENSLRIIEEASQIMAVSVSKTTENEDYKIRKNAPSFTQKQKRKGEE